MRTSDGSQKSPHLLSVPNITPAPIPDIATFRSSAWPHPHPPWVAKPRPPQPSSDGVAKRPAGLERRRRRGRDVDALAGAGIAPPAGRARSGREGAESGDPDGLAMGKRVGDGREHGAHGGVGVRVWQRSLGGDAGGEVGLVHSGSPSKVPSFERTTLIWIDPVKQP